MGRRRRIETGKGESHWRPLMLIELNERKRRSAAIAGRRIEEITSENWMVAHVARTQNAESNHIGIRFRDIANHENLTEVETDSI